MEDDRNERRMEKLARRDAKRHDWVGDEGEESMVGDSQADDSVEGQIRKRVERRLKEREAFMRHLVSYIAVNAMLWAIWAFSGHGFPWPIFVTFGWGIGLVSNALQVYQNSAKVAAAREEAIQREIELEKRRMGLSEYGEKPKRDRVVGLSDDGELVPLDEDERDEVVNKGKRG